MPKPINIELSKSAIHGAIEFAKDRDIEKRDINILDRISYHSNIEEGKKLVNLLGAEIFIDLSNQKEDKNYKLFLQEILKKFLLLNKPSYFYALTHGLREFKESLSDDEIQCFKEAGLMEKLNLKNDKICKWWDDIEKVAWEENKRDNLETGRVGEKKTLEFEENRLKKLRINKSPLWESRISNRSGFDILSYDKIKKEIFEIYIESKCTENPNGYFYLSKGEWRKANEKKDKYYVYHWYSKGKFPRIIDYDELTKHIPKNRGEGVWESMIVQLKPLK